MICLVVYILVGNFFVDLFALINLPVEKKNVKNNIEAVMVTK